MYKGIQIFYFLFLSPPLPFTEPTVSVGVKRKKVVSKGLKLQQ